MLTVGLLHAYRMQNPRKYAQKYGDKTPEEVIAGASVVSKPVVEVTSEVVEPVVEAPKKRGRPSASKETNG